MESRPAGQLFDIGYQRYDGPRQGRNRARLALFTSGLRQSMGLGRGARSKILPILMVLVSIFPTAIILVIATLSGDFGLEGRPVELGDYFPIITALLLILTGILAPGLLVSDRTENVLSLYLVRPMGIMDYLAGRWLAFFVMTTAVVLLGPLLLLLGYILLSDNAAQEFRDNWLDFPKIFVASMAMGALLTSLPMGVAAFTPRRVYAAAVVIGGVLALSVAVGILTEGLGNTSFDYERPITEEELAESEQFLARFEEPGIPAEQEIFFGVDFPSGESRQYVMTRDEVLRALEGGNVRVFEVEAILLVERDIAKWVVFADPTGALVFVTDLLFTDVETNNYRELVAEHPDYYAVAGYLVWVLIPLALMWWRYRRYVA